MKNKYKPLDVGGAILDAFQLENYLQKLASDQILSDKSSKRTFPIPRVKDNLKFIFEVYNILNEDLKAKIPIHPAGEWILDNFYIIEKNAKIIIKDLTLKKYTSLIGIANGAYKGYARAYVLAKEIISYTDGKIDGDSIEKFLRAYQNKKTLSMEELWSISTFLQICLIEKIRNICEKIYLSQMQKRKVESIVLRLVEFKENGDNEVTSNYKIKIDEHAGTKYPFIEYMSYRLKKYGKRSYSYIEILEEQVNKMGTTVIECINREHFDIAAKKISVGNSITSINILNRLNFVTIFDKINGVEEVLKNDPSGVYAKMDYKTKEYYRAEIEKISKKTKISELYIAQKCVELSSKRFNDFRSNQKEKYKSDKQYVQDNAGKFLKNTDEVLFYAEPENLPKNTHVGYYLVSDGKSELLSILLNKKITNKKSSGAMFVVGTSVFSILLACLIGWYINIKTKNFLISFICFLALDIPIKNILIKINQYISGKAIKPKLIPKLDFEGGIPKECATMVVIPTIVKSKEKVQEIMRKLEVYYVANKSENLYFTLLGDCSCEDKAEMEFDKEIVQAGIDECKRLNEKYSKCNDKTRAEYFYSNDKNDDKSCVNYVPRFNFIYRKRTWNKGENCYLGWERKRGLLNQFNEYMLGNEKADFLCNTFEISSKVIPKIKYIITLDSDTNLVLNTAFELVGAMAHILNKPELDDKKNIVVDGYGIMQPRVGIGLADSNKSLFTKIFSGVAGTDSYTNAVSDFYQDNFEQGIYTGKGIYDLQVFSKVLKNEIPENTVLSHDLLEGNYLKCGLVSDVMLMDGFPTSYASYKTRLSRWIRGDYQILSWLGNKKLNILSKYKIIDNIARSAVEPCVLILFFINFFIKSKTIAIFSILAIIIPYVLDLVNKILFKKNGELNQKKYSKEINGYGAIAIKAIIDILLVPDKAILSLSSGVKSLYRAKISKKHMLEWTTAEEAELASKNGILAYYFRMLPNVILGFFAIICGANLANIFAVFVGILWIIAPALMNYISKPIAEKKKYEELNNEEKDYVYEVARRTWLYFKDNLNESTNYLPPDNYQEGRREVTVNRTSSTNIGLALISVIASYDLGFENKEDTMNLLEKMLETIAKLQTWNGHLYNWYNISNLAPLYPKYISSVDSGNFVGYLYVLKQFLIDENDDNQRYLPLISLVDEIIENTDFSKLFDKKTGLFSIGFNIEENKMTDSYYDLLASEARQTSVVAIAKKDVPARHWKNLSRALTTLNRYKGLISWSGTAFEYLMPSINIKRYPGSLLDESCKFMIMSQMEYAKKLGITWGISEAAFNLKDFNGNYQYKAFGIPWLGLKRGLADEMVVSSYGTILAINDVPKEVIKNLKKLEQCGMYNKYGFYESIDYTPGRAESTDRYDDKGYAENRGTGRYSIVKTYMAHHQGLILLAIDNLMKDNILQKRFFENPEIESIDILLQERMPDNVIITKEKKEHIEKIKYTNYDYYSERIFDKKSSTINECNLISNNEYSVFIDKNGNGYSKYKNYIVNRFKQTDDIDEGIHFYIKDTQNNVMWSPINMKFENEEYNGEVKFCPDKSEFSKNHDNIKTTMSVIITPEEPVEIRNLNIKNIGKDNKLLEISSVFEPVISEVGQDYAHKAFNNLFLSYEFVDNILIVKRKFRESSKGNLYLAATMVLDYEENGTMQFEVDKAKLYGHNNFGVPELIRASKPFGNKAESNTSPVAAFRKQLQVEANSEQNISVIISVSESKNEAVKNVKKYTNNQDIERAFKLSKAQVEAKIQYLGISGKDVSLYGRILSHLLFKFGKCNTKFDKNKIYKTSELWKYGILGDNPILMVEIKEISEIDIVKKLVKAFEYYQLQNIKVDLVILNNEPESYEKYLQEAINEIIWNYKFTNNQNGIFLLNNITDEDMDLLKVRADLVLNGNYGKIEYALDEFDYEYSKIINDTKYQNKGEKNEINKDNKNVADKKLDMQNLLYYNEYAGFSQDGKEYIININKEKKLPATWCNIIANENFGTVVTENMGGYTWYKNSRLNRITAWNNDVVMDVPSEVIYYTDEETKASWTTSLSPMEDDGQYYVKYGLGYAKYIHSCHAIEQNVQILVPKNDSVKINIITLKNLLPQKRNIKLTFYVKAALDEDEIKSNGYINLEYDPNSNCIIAKNIINDEFKNYMYISSSEKINSYTGSKKEFFGSGNLTNPDGVKIDKFSGSNSINNDGIIAINIDLQVDALENKEISLIMGAENSALDCKNTAYRYDKVENCKRALDEVKKYWEDLTSRVVVSTPVDSINILSNSWIIYQAYCSRIIARTGYYQSGGAYGFRDQLQDSMCMKYFDSNITKNQIIKHSKHQFIEGDVLHWWHEDTKRGVRTRFSDDLLWLAYVVSDYIEYTGDYSILDIETPYLKGDLLEENVDERYDLYDESNLKETIYMHCIRAIKKSLNFGKHGIPKIGSGDWNDGFSTVGNKGIGESVWLGFFLYDILNRFNPICEYKNDEENKNEFKKISEELKVALNSNCWDGRWYNRAFCDDGAVIGSIHNQECRIDGISQSWAVISGAGEDDKKYTAMESLENHLVDRGTGIIKLLDPPFENGNINPGYIKSYLPGTRENGGQYTHGAIWAIIAEAMLGYGDKAVNLYKMISPIEHSKTRALSDKYKIEPYVIAADIYGHSNLLGQGGWSWYTGSASWYYICIIKYILGLQIENGILKVKPAIPRYWSGYSIRYKYGNSVYNIKIKNENGDGTNVRKVIVNGEVMEEKIVRLVDNGSINEVEILL